MTSLRRLMFAKAASGGSGGGWRTATGAVASFIATRSTALPMEFDLVPIQSGTGDPSPENVRPITGHDGFTTIGTDAILYDYQNDPPVQGTINGTTGKAASNLYRIRTPYIKVKPNTAYTIRTNLPYAYVHEFMSNNENSYIGNLGEWFEPPFSFTTTATTQYIRLVLALNSGGSTTKVTPSDLEYCNVLENAVSTIRQTTFDTPPGTVYGGHVTDNGDGTYDLTVDRAMFTVDENSNITKATNSDGFLFYCSAGTEIINNSTQISNMLTYSAIASDLYAGINMFSGYARGILYFKFGLDIDTKEKVQEKLAQTALQIVTPLATPVTYTGLALTALQSLIGQNHVWVDNADSVTVEYWGH